MERSKSLVTALLVLAIVATSCSLSSSAIELTDNGPVPYDGAPRSAGEQSVAVEDPQAAHASIAEALEAADNAGPAGAALVDEEPSIESESPAAAVSFQSTGVWAVPVDASRILNRIIMTGRWAGRQEPHSRRGVEAGDPGSCRMRTFVPLPDAGTVTTRSWGGGIDATLSAAVFEFGDADKAHDYVAATAGGSNDCVPAEIGPAFQDFDVSEYGLNPDHYRGQRITYEGNERVTEIVFTTHEQLAIVVQMHTALDPTPYDPNGWQEFLEKLDLALASPPFLESTGSPLMSADEFEEMMVSSFRERAFDYSTADYECILGENLDNIERTGDQLPGAVLSYVVRWCAPHVIAAQAASAEFPFNIRIDDDEKRLCYATVLAEAPLRPTYLQMIDERDEKVDPYGEARAAIDARLLDECGVTADEV